MHYERELVLRGKASSTTLKLQIRDGYIPAFEKWDRRGVFSNVRHHLLLPNQPNATYQPMDIQWLPFPNPKSLLLQSFLYQMLQIVILVIIVNQGGSNFCRLVLLKPFAQSHILVFLQNRHVENVVSILRFVAQHSLWDGQFLGSLFSM